MKELFIFDLIPVATTLNSLVSKCLILLYKTWWWHLLH